MTPLQREALTRVQVILQETSTVIFRDDTLSKDIGKTDTTAGKLMKSISDAERLLRLVIEDVR